MAYPSSRCIRGIDTTISKEREEKGPVPSLLHQDGFLWIGFESSSFFLFIERKEGT
jgi:hypothetical protein